MNKKFIIAAGIVLLAAGCGKTQTVQPVSPTPQPATQQQSQTSLKDLMLAGGSKTCTVSFQAGDAQSQGTIYLGGGKMRGDFTGQIQGKSQTSHMINDGTSTYTWVDGMSAGFKMDNKAVKPENTNNNDSSKPKNLDENAKYQYSCSNWSADESEFTPPTNVNFNDFSNLMPQVKIPNQGNAPAAPKDNSAACSACNSVPASAQAQCKAALGCK